MVVRHMAHNLTAMWKERGRDTGSRNLYRKLVQVILYKKVACVLVSVTPYWECYKCTSFFVQVLCMQLCTALFHGRTLQHMT